MTDFELERLKNVLGGADPPEAMIRRHDRWLRAWHRVQSGPLPTELLVVLADDDLATPADWMPERGEEVMVGENGMQRRATFVSRGPGGKFYVQPVSGGQKQLVRPDAVMRYDG